jgi:hypothetical protein
MDRLPDTVIGGAATDITRHRAVDIIIGRFRRRLQKRHGGHDLSGLTVPALRHVDRNPGFVDGLGLLAFDPSTVDIGVMQLRRVVPSMWTVQAPHWAMPQPYFVPLSFSKSRMTQSNGVSGSPSKVRSCPLSLKVIMFVSRIWLRTWGVLA